MFKAVLRELVAQTGKTQKEVAAEMGLSQQRFNYYATGKREPDIETLKAMSNYFGVSVDYLTGNIDKEELNMQKNAPTAYSDERIGAILQDRSELTEFANQIRMLNREQTLRVIDYIQYLLSQQEKS